MYSNSDRFTSTFNSHFKKFMNKLQIVPLKQVYKWCYYSLKYFLIAKQATFDVKYENLKIWTNL